MSMTESDVDTLRYFADVRDDPTRWVGWETHLPEIRQRFPALVFAWDQYQAASEVYRIVAKAI